MLTGEGAGCSWFMRCGASKDLPEPNSPKNGSVVRKLSRGISHMRYGIDKTSELRL